ncbi:M43 family zinc metalloprotease [Poritiphilus flavus]|uniref:Peptidase M43 pregnancy-associated plasma-A domain-containing protein n=1 Tax=Poritiphilus flavus TaxID=2697053 RepID=A0A6L9E9J7_9FLAO|nr:M43 family zinc metalloprotease [Poritiphilus flavus]NAS11149.1 hypothetical protein [Poritiphilus flavus]
MLNSSKYERFILLFAIYILSHACSKDNTPAQISDPDPIDPDLELVQLPIVVHVIHNGEEIGAGPNLSTERILRQIAIINEDFRRKEGTKGYNEHPDGADSRVEFVLAKKNPDSESFNGINRIDASTIDVEDLGYSPNHYSQYAYWDPNQYINVWTTPLPAETSCVVLGLATGPLTDLPGTELLAIPQEGDAEGILINWSHFGESVINCHARYGRTLTHEMGHYLGLLHPWGGNDCESNDFCDDTPPVDKAVFGRTAFEGCSGESIMIANYMNYSDDEVMNIFTKDQVDRIRYVLKNHPGRNNLITSPALQ